MGNTDNKDVAVKAPSSPPSPTMATTHASETTNEKAAGSSALSTGASDQTVKDSGMVHEDDARSASQATAFNPDDPLGLGRHRKEDITRAQIKKEHPSGSTLGRRKLRKYYTRQNELIDQFLGAGDEERLAVAEEVKMGPKIRFAVNASFIVNFCLFCIQLYAAVSTGSLSLFATAADAFMDLVSSFVMFTTSRMAARPSIYKYPVVRRTRSNPSYEYLTICSRSRLRPGPYENRDDRHHSVLCLDDHRVHRTPRKFSYPPYCVLDSQHRISAHTMYIHVFPSDN